MGPTNSIRLNANHDIITDVKEDRCGNIIWFCFVLFCFNLLFSTATTVLIQLKRDATTSRPIKWSSSSIDMMKETKCSLTVATAFSFSCLLLLLLFCVYFCFVIPIFLPFSCDIYLPCTCSIPQHGKCRQQQEQTHVVHIYFLRGILVGYLVDVQQLSMQRRQKSHVYRCRPIYL